MKYEAEGVEILDPPRSLNTRALAAFGALGQPTRLSMLRLLVAREPSGMSVGEIALAIKCPQSALQQGVCQITRTAANTWKGIQTEAFSYKFDDRRGVIRGAVDIALFR